MFVGAVERDGEVHIVFRTNAVVDRLFRRPRLNDGAVDIHLDGSFKTLPHTLRKVEGRDSTDFTRADQHGLQPRRDPAVMNKLTDAAIRKACMKLKDSEKTTDDLRRFLTSMAHRAANIIAAKTTHIADEREGEERDADDVAWEAEMARAEMEADQDQAQQGAALAQAAVNQLVQPQQGAVLAPDQPVQPQHGAVLAPDQLTQYLIHQKLEALPPEHPADRDWV
ncbi:hypothetical protein FOCC_FOCC006212, partial [Frankliniella occidentalis]